MDRKETKNKKTEAGKDSKTEAKSTPTGAIDTSKPVEGSSMNLVINSQVDVDQALTKTWRNLNISDSESGKTHSDREADATLKPSSEGEASRSHRMSGAARRKMHKLIDQGMNKKEAWEKARQHLNKDPNLTGVQNTPKRKRTNTSTPTNTAKLDAKRTRTVGVKDSVRTGSPPKQGVPVKTTRSYAQNDAGRGI